MNLLLPIREFLVGKRIKMEKRLELKVESVELKYGNLHNDDYVEIAGTYVKTGKPGRYKLNTIPELLESEIEIHVIKPDEEE